MLLSLIYNRRIFGKYFQQKGENNFEIKFLGGLRTKFTVKLKITGGILRNAQFT